MGKAQRSWAVRPQILIVLLFITIVILAAAILGEDGCVIAVQDDLDLFQAQYADLRNTGTFFSQGAFVSELGGVTRDAMPSELSLTAFVYMLLPPFAAYIACYILKIIISVMGFSMLSCELYGWEDRSAETGLTVGALYGILNLFPAFGIAFASIPLVIYLFIRVIRTGKKRYFVCLFLYPFLSYLSYIGIFVLFWAGIFWVFLTLKTMTLSERGSGAGPVRFAAGIILLSAGYAVFEYRLVRLTLTGPKSIRSSFAWPDTGLSGAMKEALSVFVRGQMHSDPAVTWFVLPVCLIFGLLLLRKLAVRRGGDGNSFSLPEKVFGLSLLMITVNSLIYGLQDIPAVRNAVWGIFPFISSLQFDRAVFLNPFLWYLAFLSVLLSCGRRAVGNVMAAIAAFIILLHPGTYNDILNTAKQQALQILTGKEGGSLTYGEFYDTGLYDRIKEGIGYEGEWCVCYGLHPAVLNYNGIRTLDGYLGFYPMEYKERFREVISPALEKNPWARDYFDGWGARCVLFPAEGQNIWSGERRFDIGDTNLYIDKEALGSMGCRFLFSRYPIENAEEAGLFGERTYEGKAPFSIWVYDVRSAGE